MDRVVNDVSHYSRWNVFLAIKATDYPIILVIDVMIWTVWTVRLMFHSAISVVKDLLMLMDCAGLVQEIVSNVIV